MLPNDPRRKRFIAAYNAGAPLGEIARNLGMSHRTARRWQLHYGLPDRPRKPIPNGKKLPDFAIDFIRQHYRQPGWTADAIASRLGITRNTVIGRANRMGLSRKPGTERQRSRYHRLPDAPDVRRCQWITGEVSAAGEFSYCGEAVAHKSYCQHHAERAYPLLRVDADCGT